MCSGSWGLLSVLARSQESKIAELKLKAIKPESQLDEQYYCIFSRTRHGRYAEVDQILSVGIPVDVCEEAGNTVLILAAQQGHVELCQLAVACGAAVNKQNLRGNTALHYCFSYGYKALVDVLISHGADKTIRNVDGRPCTAGFEERDESWMTESLLRDEAEKRRLQAEKDARRAARGSTRGSESSRSVQTTKSTGKDSARSESGAEAPEPLKRAPSTHFTDRASSRTTADAQRAESSEPRSVQAVGGAPLRRAASFETPAKHSDSSAVPDDDLLYKIDSDLKARLQQLRPIMARNDPKGWSTVNDENIAPSQWRWPLIGHISAVQSFAKTVTAREAVICAGTPPKEAYFHVRGRRLRS